MLEEELTYRIADAVGLQAERDCLSQGAEKERASLSFTSCSCLLATTSVPGVHTVYSIQGEVVDYFHVHSADFDTWPLFTIIATSTQARVEVCGLL